MLEPMNDWVRSIPRYDPQRAWREEAADLAKALEQQNSFPRMDGMIVVRTPRIEGRIRLIDANARGDVSYVEYIAERWYDSEKKQSRNKKVIIGYIQNDYPTIMYPNDNYDQYFDINTGEPKATGEENAPDETAGANPAGETAKADATGGETATVNTPEEKKTEMKKKPESTKPEKPAIQTEKADTARDEKTPVKENMKNGKPEKPDTEAATVHAAPEKKTETKENTDAPKTENTAPETSTAKAPGEERAAIRETRGERTGQQGPKMIRETADHRREGINEMDHPAEQNRSNEGPEQKDAGQQGQKMVPLTRERYELLRSQLRYTLKSIDQMAKKHPNMLVGTYKARKINKTLSEIRTIYLGTEYEDMLDLIDEPHRVEVDGETNIEGMSYTDVQIMLNYYIAVFSQIRPVPYY